MTALARTNRPLLEACDIAKAFMGVPAIHDGRVTVRAGSVNALCGGNGAGKSTFLNVVMGLLPRDAGVIRRDGRDVVYQGPGEALADGIGIITQELSPIPDMTVAENLSLGREPRRGPFVDRRRMEREAQALLERLGFGIDARARMGDLTVARMQLVEIARAIGRNSRVIIMDEPTSAIGERETGVLFDAIKQLKAEGVGIVYVSHRLDDIFAIADDYTVFRDARFVEEGRVADIDRRRLVSLIVGRELDDQAHRPARAATLPLLQATGFSHGRDFCDISLTLERGEILGLYGLMGAGRSEFASALYGTGPRERGEVRLNGRTIRINGPADALSAGIAMITEDRKETGLVLSSSVRHNVTMASMRRFSRAGFVNGAAEGRAVNAQIARFSIRTASPDLPVQYLSGGNQQKVAIAKCVETEPVVLICDEPTRGVDEGAKREIHTFLSDFAARGNAVLLISSEIPEILANTDRIIVFRRGRIAGELPAAKASQSELVHLSS